MGDFIEPAELKVVGRTPIINLLESEIQMLKDLFSKELQKLIKKKFAKAGISENDPNVQRITKEGSKYEHYVAHFGTTKEKRIISIQKEALLQYDDQTIEIRCIYF